MVSVSDCIEECAPLFHALAVSLFHKQVCLCCVAMHLDLGIRHPDVDVLQGAHEIIDEALAVLAHYADHAVVAGCAIVNHHLHSKAHINVMPN